MSDEILTRADLLDPGRGWPFRITGDKPDREHSISSAVLRGVYHGQRAVIVEGGPKAKTQLAALLDLLHLHYVNADTGGDVVDPDHVTLVLGGAALEALDAVDTLRENLRLGPEVHVLNYQLGEWVTPAPSTFDPADASAHYPRWSGLLRSVGTVPDLVRDLVTGVGLLALRAYPMLNKKGFWSIRLEGLELARIDASGGTLDVGRDHGGEQARQSAARRAWQQATGNTAAQTLTTSRASLADAIATITTFAACWRAGTLGDASVLGRQNEHALESRILRGRTLITTNDGTPLALLRGSDRVVNWGSQFPTKWGRDGGARYLDALLRDGRTPWVIEMKVAGSAGVGQYYRHAIAQAVLYRHFIQEAGPLHWWFDREELDPTQCRAAVVVPRMIGPSAVWRDGLQTLCRAFNVELIEVDPVHAVHASTMTSAPANIAPFGSGAFPVQVLVARSITDGEWGIDSVLVRTDDGTVNHPAWPQSERSNRPSHWSHLAQIVGEGGGDAGPDWSLAGFETTDDDASVVAIAAASFNPVTDCDYGPVHAFAGVLVPGALPDGGALALPLYLLRDDDGQVNVLILDSRRISRYRMTVSQGGRARWGTFHSAAYPLLNGRPSWQVDGGISFRVEYGVDSIDVNVDSWNRPNARDVCDESEKPIHDEAALFRAAGCTDWDGIEAMIDAEVEPLEQLHRTVSDDGFSIELLGGTVSTEFRMYYPFTLGEFWRELAEVEESVLADLDTDVGDD